MRIGEPKLHILETQSELDRVQVHFFRPQPGWITNEGSAIPSQEQRRCLSFYLKHLGPDGPMPLVVAAQVPDYARMDEVADIVIQQLQMIIDRLQAEYPRPMAD